MDAIEIFKLFGSIFVDNDEANKSISKTGDEAEGMGSKLGSGIKTAGKWAAGIAVAAGAAGTAAFAMTKKVTDGFDKIAKDSAKLGVSTDAYQEMEYWASQNGLSSNDMEKAVGRLNQRIGLAAEGNEKYAGALERLGVNMDDVREGTVTTEEAMYQSISALSEMTNEQEKSALASELFGTKLARELMPALQDGSLSLEDAAAKAEELGIVIEEDSLRAAETFNDTWDDLTRMMGAFGQKIIAEMMPMFQTMMDWVIANMPTIQAVFQTVFDVIGTIFNTAIGWIQSLISWLGEWRDNNSQIFLNIWETIQTYLGFIVEYWTTIWQWIVTFFQENGQALFDNVSFIFGQIWSAIETIINFVRDIIVQLFEYIVPWVQEKLQILQDFWVANGEQIMQAVENAFSFIQGVIEFVMPVITAIIEGAWAIIQAVFDTVIGVIMGLVQTFASLLTGDFEGIKAGLTSIWESLWEGIKGIVEGAWDLLSGAFAALWGSIETWFGDIASDALDWGKDLIRGFWEGIKGMGSWIGRKVSGFIEEYVPGPIKAVLGIASPSKLTEEYGENTGEGLVGGIENTTDDVERAAVEMARAAHEPVDYGKRGITGTSSGLRRTTTGNRDETNMMTIIEMLKNILTALIEKRDVYIDGEKVTDTINEINAVRAVIGGVWDE